ncbi:MAG: ankyrin repeat domain-containing protein, partial [Akkermansia sp.]|nr:ankyrin repeat domain-containing protein [Akkermansia sp.]
MSCRAIQIAALLVPSSLWAAAPESLADKTIRISMIDAVVARADLHKPAKGPWYRLQDMEDFVLEFPQSNTYIDAAAYCPYKPAMVTVNYTRHTDNNAEATLQSKDFTVQIALNYTREDAGTATIAWHEAGDTRYFRNAAFTIESDAKRHAGLVLPMEQIARDPEMWDDGLQGILTEIEKMVPGNAIERLYTKRLCTLLPLVMMTFDASHTTPEFKGNTALHYACGLSHVELVRWLVEHGADLQACTDNGTGIDACVSGKNAAAIKAILREARAWRDSPRHGVEIDAAAACEAASWLDEAFSGNELDSPD